MPLRLPGILLLLTATAPVATVYDSPQAGFAFAVPAGWEAKPEKEEAFPVLLGPKDDPGAPYVIIKEVRGPKDVIDLANATVREMLKDQIYQLSARDAFQTADKQDAYKYVFTTVNEPFYRQTLYFFEGGAGRIFVILATIPEAGWKKYEPVLDTLAASFHLRPAGTPPASVDKSPPKPARPVLRGGGR